MRNRLHQLSGLCLAFPFVLLFSTSAPAQSTETVLYNFCPGGGNCSDGSRPCAGLIADAQRNLSGTTAAGGANNGGTVFELTPPSDGARLQGD